MLSQTIRRDFLKFFKDNGHTIVPSSSVVPHDDPSLLFINAGMNQFKDVFLGKSERDYVRAATSQKCIRVGGKHNDLDNVGHTTRHLTLFEMLGNFSFGDYFKKESIEFAWKVSTEIFKIPDEKIWVSVFEDDDEAYELWKQIVPTGRIVRMGEEENFWTMGDTGPCGPCSELLFDRGEKYGPGKNPHEDPSGERYFEFWNLVFMQFNRDAKGKFTNLPKQSIDTGSGLERVVALKMDVDNVFSIDIFRSLIAQAENILGVPYNPADKGSAAAFHVIADHIRSLSFAIADGAQPSNIERGYVLRKILRRAVRYGKQLGVQEPFLAKVLPRLVDIMGQDYPELKSSESKIAEILTLEEESFFRTLKRGGNILSQVVEKAISSPLKQIEGEDAFKLKDTYGFPLEEVLLIAKDAGLEVNIETFQILEEKAKELSRAAASSTSEETEKSLFEDFVNTHGTCKFNGYEFDKLEGSILAIFYQGKSVESLSEGQEGMILLSETPFYAEKGGQVGDTGTISHHKAHFSVKDCQNPYPGVIVHIGTLEKGVFIPGEPVLATIDKKRRQQIANNHTATHLLHYALEKTLGSHIRQAGSLVEQSRLRFDFNHHKSPTKEDLRAIEKIVNDKIRENHAVHSYEMSYEEAQNKQEVKQFFGDKYGSVVRVVDIHCSKELCGGTHTGHTGSIGLFRILKEGSIASGVRRIEAVTGHEAEEFIYSQEEILDRCASLLKAQPGALEEKLSSLIATNKEQADSLKVLKRNEIKSIAKDLKKDIKNIKDIRFISSQVSLSIEEMQQLALEICLNEENLFVQLATQVDANRCQLLVKITPDLQKKGLHAGNFIKKMAPLINGNGGGKADMAQAGGKSPEGIHSAFEEARSLLESS
jgi:alanyl-tRNA synthetase